MKFSKSVLCIEYSRGDTLSDVRVVVMMMMGVCLAMLGGPCQTCTEKSKQNGIQIPQKWLELTIEVNSENQCLHKLNKHFPKVYNVMRNEVRI